MSAERARAFLLAELTLLVLNVLDSAFTHMWLTSGAAVEANPLLAAAWETHPVTFHGLKAALVFGGASILHHLQALPAARAAMGLATACYGAVVAWHLSNM